MPTLCCPAAGGQPGAAAQDAAIANGARYMVDPTFRVHGMDLAGRRPAYEITAGRDLTPADAGKPVLLMLDQMASDLGLAVCESVVLGLGEQQTAFEVVGLMKTEMVKTAFMRTSVEMLAGTAQVALSYTAQVEPERALDALKALNDALPREAYVLHVDDQMMAVTQTLDFQMAILGIVSLLSLVAALLLILNDVSLSIAQRQRELAVMKVTGITPGHLLGSVAAQYGVIGVVGGVQGGMLSLLLVALVAEAVLNRPVTMDGLVLATPLATGVLAGVAAVAAAVPGLARRPGEVLRGG